MMILIEQNPLQHVDSIIDVQSNRPQIFNTSVIAVPLMDLQFTLDFRQLLVEKAKRKGLSIPRVSAIIGPTMNELR